MKAVISRFINNEDLWHEIRTKVKKAKHTWAAIAYLGKGGAKLLPLKKGDRLIVDMSLGTVRQGATNPKEVKKLIDKKVEVFSRASLHAKIIIADESLIASSANVSKNSHDTLDEAGIITTDPAAIRRASDFFERLCTEPVRRQYLKECIKAYKSPRFFGKKTSGKKKGSRVIQAKLWFVGNVRSIEPPEEDAKSITVVEKRAEKKLQHPDKFVTSWIQYGGRLKYFDQIRVGDWVVVCSSDGSSRHVGAPKQFLGEDSMISYTGKKYTMLTFEEPINVESMPLSVFRRRVKSVEPLLDKKSPRTRPIENNEHADAILRLWTSAGRLSQRK